MDNKIVSTTYVPLEPPYQIIKYLDDIAMQIGTLIVTIQKEGGEYSLGYEIETHSHPVVSYENKFNAKPNSQLSSYHYLEGAVWDNVEVKDVTTICLSNAILPWHEFIDFLWTEIYDSSRVVNPSIEAYWALDNLCVGVDLPKFEHYTVHLDLYDTHVRGRDFSVISSRTSDIFALNAEATNEGEMYETIRHEIANYIMILRNRQHHSNDLKITYETDTPDCEELVCLLNSSKVFTEPLNPVVDEAMDLMNAMKRKK